MSDIETPQLAQLVRRYRLSASLSQEELAERSGLSARAISDMERGLRRGPRLESIRMLAEALGLTDDQRAALLAAARPELRDSPTASASPQSAGSSATTNLPGYPTPLIGRERDVAQLVDELAEQGTRLLTLTGPGGVGKTRLAVEVAGNAASAFADGALFVDLAPITDPGQVASAIAQSLGIRESGDRPVRDMLRTALAERQILLVIDNFEQVIDAAPLLADLLAASSQLRILVTSREPLRLRGEREFAVHPLALPDAGGPADPEALTRVASVELFVQSSVAARPDFALTQDHAPAVAGICRRVEGLPLAIELAAARIRHFSPEVLLAHLDQRLPLLTGGPRDLPARQQSVHATIAWSYDLLSAGEQTLLRWIGVFSGGAALESVEAVVRSAGIARVDVLSYLSSLVDKSLLRQRGGDDAYPRFAMLELVREFTVERLHECGEYEAVRQAHAEHILDRVRSTGSTWATHLHGFPGQDVIDAELDNIRLAFDWFAAHHDAASCAQFVDSVWAYFYVHGLFRESLTLGKRTLEMAEDQPVGDGLRVTVLGTTSTMASVLGDPSGAVDFGEQAVEIARRLPSETGLLPLALIALAIAWRDQRRFAEAMDYAEQALPASRAAGVDEYVEPHVLYHIGRLAYLLGDLARAARDLKRSLEIIHRLGPTETELYSLTTLAAVEIRLNHFVEAARLLRQGRLLVRRAGYGGLWFDSAVLLAAQRGFPEEAARMLGFYTAYYASIGVAEVPFDPLLEAAIDRLRDELGVLAYETAYLEGALLSFDDAQAVALSILDGIELQAGAPPDSRT